MIPDIKFLDKMRRKCAAIIRARGVPEAEVDDVVQDVFAAAYRAEPEPWASLFTESQVATWFGTVANNKAINYLVRQRPVVGLEHDPPSPRDFHGPAEAHAQLQIYISELSDEEVRRVAEADLQLAYRFWGSYETHEVDALTGATRAANRKRQQRALAALCDAAARLEKKREPTDR